jgi:dihydrofolate synthase/folylpolyglutamate synthase
MNYEQTLYYLFSQLPMFQRTGAAAYKADLNNTIELCNLVNNPQNKFRTIHVAGTNGKGSTSHMLAAVLQAAGYKVGLYTSPHLKDFRERIKINGEMIDKNFVTDFVNQYKPDFERIQPSFFEMTVALCFDYFGKEKVDIAVIETGLGGRLDSTNVINPLLSIITNISFDHVNLLGDTIEKIAAEKAGIIKKNTPVVISQTQANTIDVFNNKANKEHAPIYFADQLLSAENNLENGKLNLRVTDCKGDTLFDKLKLDLTGGYQNKNVLGVLQSIQILRQQGIQISDKAIYNGLGDVKGLTGLSGRWQTLSQNPLTICDTGHNVDGITEVLKQIKQTPHKRLHFVLGMVNDKDVSGILVLLPTNAIYYFCKADIPRALPTKDLCNIANQFNLYGNIYSSVAEALKAAQSAANQDDLVFVGGSTFVVAEVV